MKNVKRNLIIAATTIAIVAGIVQATSSIQPSVGLYWTSNADPTIAPGVTAPMWQLLIRTDAPGIYYKSGTAATQWTAIGGSSAGATVTTTGNIQGDGTGGNPINTKSTISVQQLQASVSTNAAALTASSEHNTGNTTIDGTLGVTGASTLGTTGTGALTATTIHGTGAATLDSTLGVTGTSTLGVTNTAALGATTLTASISTNAAALTCTTLSSTGATTLGDATHDTTIGRDLTVTRNESVTGTGSFGGAVNMNSHLINNLTDPVSAQDAATKHYIDTSITTGSLTVSGSATIGGASIVTAGSIAGWFNNGRDGTCAFDGVTNPVAGATLSGSTYTLTRDVACATTTISTGVAVRCGAQPTANGTYYKFDTSGTLTFQGTAVLSCNGTVGNNGSAGAGGTVNGGFSTSNLCSGGNGGAGGLNANGSTAGSISGAVPAPILTALSATSAAAAGANGGACTGTAQGGGGGGGASHSGGSGGSIALTTPNNGGIGPWSVFSCAQEGTPATHLNWGTGGGGGGGETSNGGGAGGSVGGLLVVRARTIVCSQAGNIVANGGNGGNGSGTGGGGGGGGGGWLVIRYAHSSGCTAGSSTGLSDPVNTNTNVDGGTKGTKGGGGGNGDGANGCAGVKDIQNISGDGT